MIPINYTIASRDLEIDIQKWGRKMMTNGISEAFQSETTGGGFIFILRK